MSGRSLVMVVSVVLACVSVPMSSAGAQLAELIPGVRARIRAPGALNGRVTAIVTRRSADSLSIAMENGVPFQLPISAITSADISRGKSGSRGAAKGAAWGGGIGLLSGLFSDTGQEDCTTGCVSTGGFVAASVAAAGLTGAVIGALVKSERWERMDVPARVALLATPGGPVAVVSIRF